MAQSISIAPTSKEQFWFVHECDSAQELLTPSPVALRPPVIESAASSNMNFYNEYIKAIHDFHNCTPAVNSTLNFLQASLVGFNQGENVKNSASSHKPQYSYYFELNAHDIGNTLFDVVDYQSWMVPTRGLEGLMRAIDIWNRQIISRTPQQSAAYRANLISTPTQSAQEIKEPKIIALIPFNVTPLLVKKSPS